MDPKTKIKNENGQCHNIMEMIGCFVQGINLIVVLNMLYSLQSEDSEWNIQTL